MAVPTPRAAAFARANRRVAWLAVLGGVLAVTAQAVPDLAAQGSLFPPWWNAAGVCAMLALVVLAAAGLWLPARVLHALWLVVPSALVVLQLLSYTAYEGPAGGVAPWVWRLEPAALTLLAFLLPAAVAVGATVLAGASVAISAWAFAGAVPAVVAWNTPFHMSEVGFVVIFLGIRDRVAVLCEAEDAARAAAELSAARRAHAQRQAAHARLVHDDVLSVLNAARLFSGPPPRELREGADAALQALRRGAAPPGPDRPVPLSIAADWLRDRLQSQIPAVHVAVDGGRPLPASVLDAVAGAGLEAARNARRHAGAERIAAVIRLDRAGVRVVVADDGGGFDPHRVMPGRRGLSDSIVARLADVGGRARVESAPGAGTEVHLSWRHAG